MERCLFGGRMTSVSAGGLVDADARQLLHARAIAQAILQAFDWYFRIFREVTWRACGHFVRGDWLAAREDNAARINLYDRRGREAIESLRKRFDLKEADPEWRRCFMALQGELMRPETWRRLQHDAEVSRVPDLYPYREQARFLP
ncbi:isocitrate dehydrogenase kinase/phosphatase AceK regulatory subunit [endosymbiont of unidentified scaly snail isolate Monju]|uniref:isocitrate dehydrogenase kinase/phosphatase AceK regulatory subunit n=1 Tax=endosymbiont of unidentified scaly snail isolate Monju TaxID=1248727 RepID=UPI0003892952|nr:isocitrate dehydrogenase kinase/phosphatase AceK regulatory subunit [endosymbiont of unidentified scaly snail isolate Monju]BAN69299.1 isocitrate dehydrogenase kinase/phosphatase [endosymbiont of unidentified scaly snail isolate Monju]